MFGQQIDERHLMHVLVQQNPLSPAQYDEVLGRARNLSLLARERPDEMLRGLLVIRGTEPPSWTVRERVAELEELAPRWDIAMVFESVLIRTMEKAVACLRGNPKHRRAVFATVEEACEWLLAGGADALTMNSMYRRALREFEERGGEAPLRRPA
ncbi:MAG: hypothetical protein KC492_16425 [Myxococcales bacterium]|nr:hypothetical protein [Myxococcales bacterium]